MTHSNQTSRRLLFAAMVAASASLSAQSLPEGAGKEVLGQVCTDCHDLERVASQHRSAAAWQVTVERMVTMGASANAADVKTIVDYLARNFGETPAPAVAAVLPMPVFHHIHINSIDPDRSLAWYSKYWPTGQRTTIAGFPAFHGADDVYLLYTKVAQQAPGAYDKKLHRSLPQSAFWTFGSTVADAAALVDRLTKLDPKAFEFQPVYGDPDDTKGVIRSSLAPQGDQLLTVTQLRERQAREKAAPPQTRPGRADFGYLVDPDGVLVEFLAAPRESFWEHTHFWHEKPLCYANWYADHLGAKIPPTRDPQTQQMVQRERWEPCDVAIGEASYPTYMREGQLRIPAGNAQIANTTWLGYPRQCQNGHCGSGTDAPLVPSAGQVVDHVALSYPNLDDVMAHLKATGVPIDKGPYAFGATRAIMIHDLDGLSLELIEIPR